MLEQIDTKLEQQEKSIAELKNLLLEEIQLRRQDQLKITKIVNSVTEWKSQLEERLNNAFTDLHQKLDQIQSNLISHETSALVDMYQRLTQQQEHVCASILTDIEQKFKINTDALKRLNAPDSNVVQAKLAKLDIGLGVSATGTSKSFITKVKTEDKNSDIFPQRAVGIIQATSHSNPTTVPVGDACYINWLSNKHESLTKLDLVNYEELDEILSKIWKKRSAYNNHNLIPEDLSEARKNLSALKIFKVTKFIRFPSSGKFVHMDLNIKEIFTITDRQTFSDKVACNITRIKDHVLDQIVFENQHGLQWSRG